MQELDYSKHTVDRLATKVDEAEKALDASQEHVQYLEDRAAKQSNQQLAKDNEAANECERLSKLEIPSMSLSVDLQQAQAQNAINRNLLEGVKTAPASQKTASPQSISNYVKEHQKLFANKIFIDAETWQYSADMDTKLNWLQEYSDDVARRANKEEREHK